MRVDQNHLSPPLFLGPIAGETTSPVISPLPHEKIVDVVGVVKQVEMGVPVAELIRQVGRKSLRVSFADGSVLTAAG